MSISRRPFLALLAYPRIVRSETAPLRLTVSTAGAPTVARVYITSPDGKPITIPGQISYTRPVETHSIVDGSATLNLPPGKYTVRAEKGAEFRAIEKQVDVPGPSRLDLDIPRFCDMNAKGWYCGDLHIHRSPEEMPLLARAEELNIAPVITRHVGNTRSVKGPFPSKHLVPVGARHIVSLQNQEVERLFTGHGAVVLLNTPQPVEANPANLFPLDVEFCKAARRQGGFVDGEKPIWKNVPVNLAFGALDSIGVVNNHFHPHDVLLDAEKWGSMDRGSPAYATVEGFAHWMLDLYYSFLNCGFRIPVSAGSASGVMSSWPGYERVYTHLSGPFSYEQWFRDLKAGRSIATNGPLMRVLVDGRPPGAEFAFRKGMQVELAVDVDSMAPLKTIELIFNGEVVRQLSAASRIHLPIDAPGWLAARCFEPAGATVRYAHSSPFYFARNGKLPVRKADAARWADYIRNLAATLRAPDYASEKQYATAQATLKEAEAIYRSL